MSSGRFIVNEGVCFYHFLYFAFFIYQGSTNCKLFLYNMHRVKGKHRACVHIRAGSGAPEPLNQPWFKF